MPSNEQINIDEQLLPTLVVAPAKSSGVTLAFTSGNTYAGDLAGTTTMHGAGAYKWAASGVTYVGDFAASAMTGKGKYAWPDGSAYEGEVKGGIRHGFGTFCGPGGFPRYEGQWVEGRRHGKGLLVYSEGGDVYEGGWANDVREGQGTLTHASGNTYTGSWSHDQKNGHGVFEWKDRRERYTGEWKDGKCHGHGEHAWLRPQVDASPFQLRERYFGDWVAGRREGRGTFLFANGARYVGEWHANQKHGDGVLSFEDGSVYQGPFVADRMAEGKLRAHSELFSYVDLSHLAGPDEIEVLGSAVRAVLIRYNTDLKQVYRYYAALQCAAEDAFEMSLEQFWSFCIDAQLVSPSMPLAALDRLVMKGPQPALPSKPSPLTLAGQVASGGAVYEHAGEHDCKRPLLLRDFIQGFVEIAAARLTYFPPVPTPPTQPLVQSLLNLIRMAVLEMSPSEMKAASLMAPAGAAEAEEPPTELVSRLALVYAHYAAAEPIPRYRKAPREATLTVRSYVRLLSDSGLLPPNSNLPLLLAITLPSYMMPPPEDDAATGEEPETAPETVESKGEGEANEARAAKAHAAALAEAATLARLEVSFSLELIYPEFQQAMLAFAAQHADAPWAPAPPLEGAEMGAQGGAPTVEGESAAEDGAQDGAKAPAAEPRTAVESIRDVVLPAIGSFLKGALVTKAATVE